MALTSLAYRRDLDGLRAVAIILIVLFHAAPLRLPGGFIGVDVFFVISGFLITSTILPGLENGHFQLLAFYARRIRRIFPALILVLASCLIAGWFVLVDNEYKQLAKHSLGSSFFISNFIFWAESGYFDNSAETKVLLHLWSLGVEEQFYIFFPLIAYFATRLRFPLLWSVGVLTLVSFGLNIWSSSVSAAADFFLPYNRAWELLIGAFLAIILSSKTGTTTRTIVSVALRNISAFSGLLLLVAGLVRANKWVIFPGWIGLLPTVGTTLIIAAGSESVLNRYLLSNRLAVGIGRISFSLYLWHWPILVFPLIAVGEPISEGYRFGLVLMSVLLAAATYACVENPMRFGGQARLKVSICIAGLALVAVGGSAIYISQGIPSRSVSINYNKFFHMSKPIPGVELLGASQCPRIGELHPMLSHGCQLQYFPENPSARVIAVGDSHSRSWVHPLRKIAQRMRYDLTVLSYVGCPPLRGIRRNDTGDKAHCDNIENTNRFFDLLVDLKPDIVVLMARWPMYAYGHRDSNYGYLSSMTHFLSPDMVRPPSESTSMEALRVRVPETVRFLQERHVGVVVMRSPPQLLFSWNGRRPGPNGDEPSLEQHRNYTHGINQVFNSITGIVLIDPADKLCQSGTCVKSIGNTRLYYDDNHLTYEAAELFEEDLLRGLSTAIGR